ncbi:MAG: alpha/beta hydrolase [Streptococcaceae bacterium]|nr:alpha/beta hydrolase [Streptococcaceae bacterium]
MTIITSDHQILKLTSYGTGTAIIFISGYSGTSQSWSAQNDFFSQLGFQCLHLDKRGHGENAAVTSGMRISRLATDLKTLIDQLELKAFHLVSHSLGCAIACDYISLFGEAGIQSLTIVDSSPKPIQTADWSLGLDQLTWDNLLTTSEQLIRTPLTQKKIPTALLRKMNQPPYPFDLVQTQPLLLDFLSKDYRDVLDRLQLPLLYIAGEQSPLFPTGLIAYYQETNPTARTYLAAGSGHLPYAECADDFNQVLLSFLQAHPEQNEASA